MMCDICKRSLMARDLTTDSNGLTVCASARWCLIAVLQEATPAEIAQLHATASDFALLAAQRHVRGMSDFVRMPKLAWSPQHDKQV
jgi:hypothetical protein